MCKIPEQLKIKAQDIMSCIFAESAECIFCGKEAKTNELCICENCAVKLMPAKNIEKLFETNKYVSGISASFLYYGTVADGIKRMKYSKEVYLTRAYSRLLNVDPEWNIDLVTSIPMHRDKQDQRGFNQSHELAKNLANRMKIEYKQDILIKVANTSSHFGSTRDERNKGQTIAVKNPDNSLNGRRVLIVDDVYTTGNTVNECAKLLKDSGATAVYVSVIAHGKR